MIFGKVTVGGPFFSGFHSLLIERWYEVHVMV